MSEDDEYPEESIDESFTETENDISSTTNEDTNCTELESFPAEELQSSNHLPPASTFRMRYTIVNDPLINLDALNLKSLADYIPQTEQTPRQADIDSIIDDSHQPAIVCCSAFLIHRCVFLLLSFIIYYFSLVKDSIFMSFLIRHSYVSVLDRILCHLQQKQNSYMLENAIIIVDLLIRRRLK